jgi:hypothetical protein
MTYFLTYLLQCVQGFYFQSILNALQLLKRRVFFASLNACIVVTVKPGFRRDFRLREAGLFANPFELLAEFFTPVILIFGSHMLINIAPFERDPYV